MSEERFLRVNVYSWQMECDCTMNGVTHTHRDKLVIPCPDGNFTQEDVDRHGYEILDYVERHGGYFRPRRLGPEVWSMNGGNYVMGDSRFNRLYGDRPVRVHDRVES